MEKQISGVSFNVKKLPALAAGVTTPDFRPLKVESGRGKGKEKGKGKGKGEGHHAHGGRGPPPSKGSREQRLTATIYCKFCLKKGHYESKCYSKFPE